MNYASGRYVHLEEGCNSQREHTDMALVLEQKIAFVKIAPAQSQSDTARPGREALVRAAILQSPLWANSGSIWDSRWF